MRQLTAYARQNRQNPTRAERKFKSILIKAGISYRTQRMYDWYIADFLIPERWLVIEIDGATHDEPAQKIQDAKKTLYLQKKGLTVRRFTNYEVLYGDPLKIIKKIMAVPKRAEPRDRKLLYGVSKF